MDVVSIPKTNEFPDFYMNTKGKVQAFTPIRDEESKSNKIVDFIKFDVGNVVMVTGGRNTGRVGILKSREKHKGSFETVHIQDATGHEFATRLGNVFTLGKGSKPWVSLPKGKGIKLTIIEEARKRQAAQDATA
uniref:Putative ribosomal protein S4e n=1 Tax=Helianthus annuus TaxID=4232 RepID=A0A251RYF9_HELAN